MIKDSGKRREFDTGAVRDIGQGKGRCDLLPLGVIADLMQDDNLAEIERFIRTGDDACLENIIIGFSGDVYGDFCNAVLALSVHYEDGANKYAERNWEKGIPLHCYIDSGVRHYLKFMRGDEDEPHHRAFIWNMLGALWTKRNRPECVDLPFASESGD